ncbi:MAG: FAD-dependent oxidoreductase [Alphaproteobacteria bacterium]
MSGARIAIVSAVLGLFVSAQLLVAPAWAHEVWVLTSEQVAAWDARPLPELFTGVTSVNIMLYVFTAVFMVAWVLLGFTGARELFPDLQVRLASRGEWVPLALRAALAIMLGLAAFGAAPRVGTPYFSTATLAAPDLDLAPLGPTWAWIGWAEAVAACAFLFGIYVRAAAALTLVLGIVGVALFGYEMLAYVGLVAAAAVYLLLQGPGSLYLAIPTLPWFGRISAWLAGQPRARAQFLLRMLAGANLLYLGIEYKFLHANLSIAVLVLHDIPTLGLGPEAFVLCMALVETLAGALVLAGILMRPLAIFLFFCFLFFSLLLGESVFSHAIFYGLLFGMFINGAGRWPAPVARDKPGTIVILGGGFAGVHCAIRLERLLDPYTNVRVTLVNKDGSFLFDPLLAEVVGGTVQPGNVVNPIRRFLPRTRFVAGHVIEVDARENRVRVRRDPDEEFTIGYDQLVLALDHEPDFGGVPGLAEHALPVASIGDALYLRQRVIELLDRAEAEADAETRRALASFVVIGGGEAGCAIAAELRGLLDSALVSYPGLARADTHVVLVERSEDLLPHLPAKLRRAARRRLERCAVEVVLAKVVAALTPDEVVLADGRRIASHTAIATMFGPPRVVASLSNAKSGGRVDVDPWLRLRRIPPNITAVGSVVSAPGPVGLSMWRDIRMGRCAAFNVLAAIQGFAPRRWSEPRQVLALAALGRRASVGRLFGLVFGGVPAWLLARGLCVLTLPGLERNLRIVIDWLLDLPFRNDIAVLAPQRTSKITAAHFEAGDEIIREGEAGNCAYVLRAGIVEIVARRGAASVALARLGPGECFGEMALLTNAPRTATARCATPVDVLVLPRDQFLLLAEGYRDLGAALRARMQDRLHQSMEAAAGR